jgi:hypothetical protein
VQSQPGALAESSSETLDKRVDSGGSFILQRIHKFPCGDSPVGQHDIFNREFAVNGVRVFRIIALLLYSVKAAGIHGRNILLLTLKM